MKISVVIPVYQGGRSVGRLVDELVRNLHGREGLEIVLVNDGSTDNSHEECLAAFRKHAAIVKYTRLAKNFGEHNAVLAGLNEASGDYAVIIDDDFQNPPEEIKKMVDKAVDGGYDVVYSYYDKKYHSAFRNIGSSFNDIIACFLLNKPRDLYLSSFKCLNRFTVNEIIKYKGPYPYIDGLVLRTTRNIGKVLVKHEKRREGRSGYTIRKLVRLWLNMFVNFSIYPLRVSTFIGFIFFLFGAVLSIQAVIERLINPSVPMGITSIFVAILMFSGLQMLMLGVIGEYLGKQFMAGNQTPQYVIRDTYAAKKEEGGR
ncbi:MAG: glycosyltransferase family 2 protein [Candidatus Omnitrophica bacterium]|nr:glycosyltransferase family 2 protein [Candidatus Omnitrophota bacterium]MDD5736855.1 glycosyltransferase family 2 protein [Candidatus Omnitrophota bacterium]